MFKGGVRQGRGRQVARVLDEATLNQPSVCLPFHLPGDSPGFLPLPQLGPTAVPQARGCSALRGELPLPVFTFPSYNEEAENFCHRNFLLFATVDSFQRKKSDIWP